MAEPPGRVSSGERLLWEQMRGEDDASPAVPAQHGRVSQTHAALQILRQGVRLRHNTGGFPWAQQPQVLTYPETKARIYSGLWSLLRYFCTEMLGRVFCFPSFTGILNSFDPRPKQSETQTSPVAADSWRLCPRELLFTRPATCFCTHLAFVNSSSPPPTCWVRTRCNPVWFTAQQLEWE